MTDLSRFTPSPGWEVHTASETLPRLTKTVHLPPEKLSDDAPRAMKLQVASLCQKSLDKIRSRVIEAEPEFHSSNSRGDQLIIRLIVNAVADNAVQESSVEFEESIANQCLAYFCSESQIIASGLSIENESDLNSDELLDEFSRAEYGLKPRDEALPPFSMEYFEKVKRAIGDGKLSLSPKQMSLLLDLCLVDSAARNEFFYEGKCDSFSLRHKEVMERIQERSAIEITPEIFETRLKRLNAQLKDVVPHSLRQVYRALDPIRKYAVATVLLKHADEFEFSSREISYLNILEGLYPELLFANHTSVQFRNRVLEEINNDNSPGSVREDRFKTLMELKALPAQSTIKDCPIITKAILKDTVYRTTGEQVKLFDFKASTEHTAGKKRDSKRKRASARGKRRAA